MTSIPPPRKLHATRYGCLTPWQSDPATYGHAALTGAYRSCESEVAVVLKDLLQQRTTYAERDGERFLDAVQNARLITNAERYYRIMYYGSRASWNLRDSHMFETLKTLLAFYGPTARSSSGLTILTSAMQPRPRCILAASITSVTFAARNSATCVFHRIWNIRRYCCSRLGLGQPNGDQDRAALDSGEL